MRTIWKYAIDIRDVQSLQMPSGARLLSVQTQDGDAQLWALVDTDAPRKLRRFRVVGTGHEVDFDPAGYVGTFGTNDGMFIWHLFDLGER